MKHESENQGMETNKSNTKAMMENDKPIYISTQLIKNVEWYVYQGQHHKHKPS